MLFLHGAGERGRDGRLQTTVGIGPQIARQPERFPLAVVMPQCPTGANWSTPEVEQLTLKALDDCSAELHSDRSRIYLTGLSMGGYGTWMIGARYPERFAALAPICGGGDPALATALKSMPIWAFHGALDEVVPACKSREMVKAVKGAGNGRIQYTEYEDGLHNVWDLAYGDPALMTWLLAQRRT